MTGGFDTPSGVFNVPITFWPSTMKSTVFSAAHRETQKGWLLPLPPEQEA